MHLSLISTCIGANEELVEDAVKYIIFLVDADRLFDTALGMYDFSLVLLVAQYSQKAHWHPYSYAIKSLMAPLYRTRKSISLSYDHLVRWRAHTSASRSTII